MDKEKEIDKLEELEEDVIEARKNSIVFGDYYPDDLDDCYIDPRLEAKWLYEKGYRKADEVRKETAREILEYLRAVQEKDELKNCDLDWIAMQYGVEVNE